MVRATLKKLLVVVVGVCGGAEPPRVVRLAGEGSLRALAVDAETGWVATLSSSTLDLYDAAFRHKSYRIDPGSSLAFKRFGGELYVVVGDEGRRGGGLWTLATSTGEATRFPGRPVGGSGQALGGSVNPLDALVYARARKVVRSAHVR
eukprot:CAMPEP_0198657698 /NCGR_PEP_ID=MMETSP1467-20131203/18931_1 /TAXON_ID=1462469 /ORGANISM="unid. sp., Strain CCMP2135" /LENGTH=147 /DNA_ID=CAMNT_0044393911 /DNA_START=271 /DNA_END=710 /DNA_ORIENTATION=+